MKKLAGYFGSRQAYHCSMNIGLNGGDKIG